MVASSVQAGEGLAEGFLRNLADEFIKLIYRNRRATAPRLPMLIKIMRQGKFTCLLFTSTRVKRLQSTDWCISDNNNGWKPQSCRRHQL